MQLAAATTTMKTTLASTSGNGGVGEALPGGRSEGSTSPGGRGRYGGILGGNFPEDHWTWVSDPDGDSAGVPIVIGGPVIRKAFTSLQDAIVAAQRVSAGERDAVAVVRAPGEGADGPWFVDRLLVNDYHRRHRWQTIDLEGGANGYKPARGYADVWQPLNSQRQVIVGAIVDGDLVLDDVARYKSSRPDLPGRDPDAPKR